MLNVRPRWEERLLLHKENELWQLDVAGKIKTDILSDDESF